MDTLQTVVRATPLDFYFLPKIQRGILTGFRTQGGFLLSFAPKFFSRTFGARCFKPPMPTKNRRRRPKITDADQKSPIPTKISPIPAKILRMPTKISAHQKYIVHVRQAGWFLLGFQTQGWVLTSPSRRGVLTRGGVYYSL